jgi:hypothetical protein
MNPKKSCAVASGLCLLLILLGCSNPVFNWMTSSPAPWWYMQSEYGGVIFDGSETNNTGIKLKFHLNKYLAWHKPASDGFYLYKATAKIQEKSIILTVYKCVEYRQYRSFNTNFSVEVPTPAPGKYKIIYNDKPSNYPVLGDLELP